MEQAFRNSMVDVGGAPAGGGEGRKGRGQRQSSLADWASRGVASAAGTFSLDPVMSYLSMKIFTILLCLNCQKVTD
jgi:hypothetical protein